MVLGACASCSTFALKFLKRKQGKHCILKESCGFRLWTELKAWRLLFLESSCGLSKKYWQRSKQEAGTRRNNETCTKLHYFTNLPIQRGFDQVLSTTAHRSSSPCMIFFYSALILVISHSQVNRFSMTTYDE